MPTKQYFALVKQSLEECGEATVRVTGKSMSPLISHMRDFVRINPSKDIHVGDVVLYEYSPEHFTLHRVIRLDSSTFDMMGDNTWVRDKKLPRSNIVGRVIVFQRGKHELSADGIPMRIYACFAVITAYVRCPVGFILRPVVHRLRRLGGTHK